MPNLFSRFFSKPNVDRADPAPDPSFKLPVPVEVEQRSPEETEQRGMNIIDKATGMPIEFSLWVEKNNFMFSKRTPILENIYHTIASEFSKIQLFLVDDRVETKDEKAIRVFAKRINDPHFDILSLRPNILQSKSELLFTIAYQLHMYRNALVRIVRDVGADRNSVIALEPINCDDYLFGQGYKIDGELYLTLKEKKTGKIILFDYADIIHLRLNPNDVFYGDKGTGFDLTNFVRVFDENLATMLKKLKDSGTIRGILEVGGGGFSGRPGTFNSNLLKNDDAIKKQDEAYDRLAAVKDGGVAVFDGGEKFHPIRDTFKTMTTEEIDNMMKYLYNFKGINQAVIDGTATEAQMGVFFNKTIMPIVIMLLEEINYKFLTKTARSQGQKIVHFRNPFEYMSTTQIMKNAYVGGMFFTQNNVRENAFTMEPIEGGDILLNNKNFTKQPRGVGGADEDDGDE